MLRIIAGICFSVLAITYGYKKSYDSLNKIRFLKELCDFITYCKEMIRYSRNDIKSIFNRASKKYASLAFLNDSQSSSCLYGYESEIEEFLSLLGKSDLSGQLQLLERYETYFNKEYQSKKEDIKKESKIFKALGIFAGSAVLVIFI